GRAVARQCGARLLPRRETVQTDFHLEPTHSWAQVMDAFSAKFPDLYRVSPLQTPSRARTGVAVSAPPVVPETARRRRRATSRPYPYEDVELLAERGGSHGSPPAHDFGGMAANCCQCRPGSAKGPMILRQLLPRCLCRVIVSRNCATRTPRCESTREARRWWRDQGHGPPSTGRELL